MNLTDNLNFPPNRGEIPIVAESCIPWPLEVAFLDDNTSLADTIDNIFTAVRECGCNIVFFKGDKRKLEKLRNCIKEDNKKIPLIIWNDELTATPYSAIDFLSNYATDQNILGWNLRDEPTYYMWGDVLRKDSGSVKFQEWNRLSVGYMIARQLTPDKLCFWTSAVPNGVNNVNPDVTGTCKTYKQYLDTLQQLYKPKLWSYDVYPFIWNVIGVGEDQEKIFRIKYQQFYNSLRLFSNQAKDNNAMFWSYGLVASHADYGNTLIPTKETIDNWKWKYDIPTKGELRFELFSALACGAQGIAYFRLATGVKIDDPEWEDKRAGIFYFDAPIRVDINYTEGLEHTKNNATFNIDPNTDLLNIITEINDEIQSLADVFLDSQCIGMYQIYVGDTNYDDGIESFYNPDGSNALSGDINISIHDSATDRADSKGVLLTVLSKKISDVAEKRYIVITSHDPFYAQVLHLELNSSYILKSYCKYSGSPVNAPKEYDWQTPSSGSIILGRARSGYYTLESGGYLILEGTYINVNPILDIAHDPQSDTEPDPDFEIQDVIGYETDAHFNKKITYPETPYLSPSPDKIPRIAIKPVPANLMELVHQDEDKYRSQLYRIMQYANGCGCNAIMTGGSHEQMRAELKAVADLGSGVQIMPTGNNVQESETNDNACADVRPDGADPTLIPGGPIIKPPIELTGPKLGVLLNPVWLHLSVRKCVKIISDYRCNKYLKGWLVMDAVDHQDWGNVVLDPENPSLADPADTIYNQLSLAYRTAIMYSNFPASVCSGTAASTDGKQNIKLLTMFTLPCSDDRSTIGTCENYHQYLKAMNKLFQPPVWACRFVPFSYMINDNNEVTGLNIRHQQLYTYLEHYRYFQDTNSNNENINPETKNIGPANYVKFMTHCQTEEYKVTENASGNTPKIKAWYPAPTLGMMRFEVFSALAYGAQGVFFMRTGMESEELDYGNYKVTRLSAPLKCTISKNADGSDKVTLNTTPTYDNMRKLNKEIDDCSFAFLDSMCTAAYHVGDLYGQPQMPSSFGCIASLRNISGTGFLVTQLERDDYRFTVIVNHDPRNSQNLTVNLKAGLSVHWNYLSPEVSANTIDANEDTATVVASSSKATPPSGTITIPAGGVLIYGWRELT